MFVFLWGVPSRMGGQRRPRPTTFVQYFSIFYPNFKNIILHLIFIFCTKFVLCLFLGGFFIVFVLCLFWLYFFTKLYYLYFFGAGIALGWARCPVPLREPPEMAQKPEVEIGRKNCVGFYLWFWVYFYFSFRICSLSLSLSLQYQGFRGFDLILIIYFLLLYFSFVFSFWFLWVYFICYFWKCQEDLNFFRKKE